MAQIALAAGSGIGGASTLVKNAGSLVCKIINALGHERSAKMYDDPLEAKEKPVLSILKGKMPPKS